MVEEGRVAMGFGLGLGGERRRLKKEGEVARRRKALPSGLVDTRDAGARR